MKSKYSRLSAQVCFVPLLRFAIHEALDEAFPDDSEMLDLFPFQVVIALLDNLGLDILFNVWVLHLDRAQD
jgi:hypothetical protein